MRSTAGTRTSVTALCGLLAFSVDAAPVLLSNCPDYDWWYGCSATSAGMLMGYYDLNGYSGLYYDLLIPGGDAELNSYNGQGYNSGEDSDGDTSPDLLCNKAIASAEHIADFWTGYGNSGDDPLGGGRGGAPYDPEANFDCTADFMGTSQDGGHDWKQDTASDGSTSWYNYNSGAQYHHWDLEAKGPPRSQSGCVGIKQYVESCGYSVNTLYNQRIYDVGEGWTSGMDFADYQAEIDAGRPALVHTSNHTMLAYGYDTTGSLVYVYDTWTSGGGSFAWAGSYGGADHVGFTLFTPSGGSASPGDVPEPGTLLLMATSLGATALLRRRRGSGKS